MEKKNSESVEDLGRGGFRLIQDKNGCCFGEDTVLLSWFTSQNLRRSRKTPLRVLELGTNCGAATILLCARREDVTVDGVERQKKASDIFKRNIELNHLEGRVRGFSLDLRDLPTADLPKNHYDAVFMNPPYRKAENGPVTSTEKHSSALLEARFAMHGEVFDFLSCGKDMLTSTGDLFLVDRAAAFSEVMAACAKLKLVPKRITFVHPYAEKEATLFLLSAKKSGKIPGTVITPPLILRDADRNYTPALRRIYFEDT